MRFLRASRWLLFALLILAIAGTAQAQVVVSVRVGPPALPVYAQPVIPGPGYIWTPGYWAYGPGGYYWVPGTWVLPPAVGLLWTPGYWGWAGGVYAWHGGYWGPHVGFYGGINYGYGYTGVGYAGGYWRGREFYYNRAVTNVNVNVVHNVYERTVVHEGPVVRTAYNGGPGGVSARATSGELAAARERHFEATEVQMHHQSEARANRAMFASANHGQPAVAATSHPGMFRGPGVEAARPAGAAKGNAETFQGQPGAAKASATGQPGRGQAGYEHQPAANYKAAPAPNASTGQPAHQMQQPRQGQPQPGQVHEPHEGQQHQGQAHEGQRQGEQREGKPHKPRN